MVREWLCAVNMEDFRFFDIYTDAWHSPIVQKEYILPDAS